MGNPDNLDNSMDNIGAGALGENRSTEQNMELDDEELEAKKAEAPRCTKCKRMTSGHEGPYGSKCDLKMLSDEELKIDDQKKMKAKEMKKAAAKRKGEHDEAEERIKKQKKEEQAEDDKFQRAQKEQMKIKKKLEDQKAERSRIEKENKKLEKELDDDTKKTNKQYGRWRENQNPANRN